METNLSATGTSKRRGLVALAGLALGASLSGGAAGLASPVAVLGAPLTPVGRAYAALQASRARRAHINSDDSTEEEVDAWCADDVAAVRALTEAASETAHDVMVKLVAILRRGEEEDWSLMLCEQDCLDATLVEVNRFFPALAL